MIGVSSLRAQGANRVDAVLTVNNSNAVLLFASTFLLSAGTVLTTATSLRVDNVFGPGEALLLVWVVVHAVYLRTIRFAPKRVVIHTLLIILVVESILFLGALRQSLGLDGLHTGSVRDLVAYQLVFVIAALLALTTQEKSFWRTLLAQFVIVTLIALLYQLAAGVIQGTADLTGARFRGWARNPNQLALLVVAVPALAVMWAQISRARYRFPVAVATFGAALWLGILSRSDALSVGWSIGLFVLLLGTMVRAMNSKKWTQVFTGLALMAALLFMTPFLVTTAYERFMYLYQWNSQGDVRLDLWLGGLAAWLESPLVGQGPGVTSFALSMTGSETHNSLIDLLAMIGILGVAPIIAVLMAVVIRVGRASLVGLASMSAMLGFATFHLVFRHPVFLVSMWLLTVTALELTKRKQKVA